jgi:hypothetical protein
MSGSEQADHGLVQTGNSSLKSVSSVQLPLGGADGQPS